MIYVPTTTRQVQTVLIRGASLVGLTLTSIFGRRRRGGEGAFSNRQRGRRGKGRRRRDLARDQNRIANERVWRKKENTITRRGKNTHKELSHIQNKRGRGEFVCCVPRGKKNFLFLFHKKSLFLHSSFSFRRGGKGQKCQRCHLPCPSFLGTKSAKSAEVYFRFSLLTCGKTTEVTKQQLSQNLANPSRPLLRPLTWVFGKGGKGGKGGHGAAVK